MRCIGKIIFILLGVLFRSRADVVATKMTRFSTPLPYQPSSMQAVEQLIISTRTKLECALICEGRSYCNAFSFLNDNKLCHMSMGVIGVISSKVYGKEGCPASLGYTLYIPENICLKHDDREVIHSTAVEVCRKDGAHLVLIENQATHSFLRQLMIDTGSGDKIRVKQPFGSNLTDVYPSENEGYDSVYIDGVDIGENGTFYSWRGDELPYIAFGPDDPDGPPETCMRISYTDNYSMKDIECSAVKQFFCQLEF